MQFGFDVATSSFIGVCLSFTALPVSVAILRDIGRLNTHFGRSVIAAAILSDIVGLLGLSLLLSASRNSGVIELQSLASLLAKLLLFIAILYAVDRVLAYKAHKYSARLLRHTQSLISREATFAFPLILALGFSFLASFLGLHFVVGTFLGTLIISEHVISASDANRIRDSVKALTNGLLAPIFFGFIGLTFHIGSMSKLDLLAALLTLAVAGKVLGGYLGASALRMPTRYKLATGIVMNGRGAMGLIVATIGLKAGLIGVSIFSVLVTIGVVTTLITPLTLRLAFKGETPSHQWERDRGRKQWASNRGLVHAAKG